MLIVTLFSKKEAVYSHKKDHIKNQGCHVVRRIRIYLMTIKVRLVENQTGSTIGQNNAKF